MNSTLEKLLFPASAKQEEPDDFEVNMEHAKKGEMAKAKMDDSNESIVQIKQEMCDDISSQNDQKLLHEIADLLDRSNNSCSSQSIKSELNPVKTEYPSSTAVFGQARVFKNERITWELKPNQMYNPNRDNGSIRGRHLICEKATYRNNGTKNNIVYWKCCFTNCKARLSTSVNGDVIVKYPTNHNHRLDGLDAQILDAKFQLKHATTSEELKQAVENIQSKYPKYVQNKLKTRTSQISRTNRRQKPKLVKFDFDKFLNC